MADVPIHSITDTWNSGVTVYYGIKMDVTNTSSAANSKLFAMQISSVNIFDIDKTGDVTITSVDAGATVGPTLTLKRFSATPAAADVAGKLAFDGIDSAANVQNYADIFATITDPTTTSEDASLTFRNSVAGTMTTQAVITATGWNSMNIGATTPGTGAFTTLTASSGYNGTVGAGTPAAGAFTTIAASGTSTLVAATLTGNLAISKASPVIALTATGTGSDSTITENSSGLTYAADANNEVASSFHIFTVDGSQKFAVGASAATFSSGVSLTASGGGSLTGTWSDLGTVTTMDLNGGTIDGTAIGGASPSTGAFTTLTTSSTIVASGTTTATRFITTGVGSATNPAVAVATAGALAGLYSSASNTLNFAINTASVGTVTSTGLNAMAIGASTRSTGAFTTLGANSTVTFSSGGSMTGTWSDLGTVTTIDINGGTLDGTVIGGASAAAGTFTTLNSTGGALNGTIGGTTPNAGTFTTVGASNSIQAGTWASNGATQGILLSAPGGVFSSVTGTGASTHYTFANANGTVGTITTNGSATTYAISSDYRLPWKEGRTAVEDSGSFIDALKPWYFPKAGKSGFVAHEFAAVSPQSVNGEKDAVDADGKPVMQTMQSSTDDVMANIIAELQSLRARVAELEAA